jgi:hypothetical protein
MPISFILIFIGKNTSYNLIENLLQMQITKKKYKHLMERKSISKMIFLLFCMKVFDSLTEKSFKRIWYLSRKASDKAKN